MMGYSCFSRGYHVAREKTEQGSKFIRTCFNCAFYNYDGDEGKEVCTNDDVSQYDLIVEGNNVYCTQWQPYTLSIKKGKKDSEIFRGGRKTGRARLD